MLLRNEHCANVAPLREFWRPAAGAAFRRPCYAVPRRRGTSDDPAGERSRRFRKVWMKCHGVVLYEHVHCVTWRCFGCHASDRIWRSRYGRAYFLTHYLLLRIEPVGQGRVQVAPVFRAISLNVSSHDNGLSFLRRKSSPSSCSSASTMSWIAHLSRTAFGKAHTTGIADRNHLQFKLASRLFHQEPFE